MVDRILDLPLAWAFAALWVIVMARANGTYWLGRGMAAGTGLTRLAHLLDSPLYLRAQAMAQRWGVLAVPLSFLTIGVQTFVQLSAGVTRMPLRLYLPAVAVGCAMWAAVYATVGLAVFLAWFESGGHWVVPVVALGAVVILMARGRRRRPQPHRARAYRRHAGRT